MPPEQLKSIYTKLPDFIQLCKKYDPQGKFRNESLSDGKLLCSEECCWRTAREPLSPRTPFLASDRRFSETIRPEASL
jgi:hypothetical protein